MATRCSTPSAPWARPADIAGRPGPRRHNAVRRLTLESVSYTYDPAANRTSQTVQSPGQTTTTNYTYDSIYELTQVVQSPTTTEGYTYDRVGNRLSSLGGSYTYNASNQMLASPGVSYG